MSNKYKRTLAYIPLFTLIEDVWYDLIGGDDDSEELADVIGDVEQTFSASDVTFGDHATAVFVPVRLAWNVVGDARFRTSSNGSAVLRKVQEKLEGFGLDAACLVYQSMPLTYKKAEG